MRALYIMLALGITAVLTGAILLAPAYADQNHSNTFSLLGASAGNSTVDSPLFLQVRRGGGGHAAFMHGGGHHGHRGAFFGGIYLGYPYLYSPDWDYSSGEGYYTQGNQVCEWNGYEYTCFRAY